MIKAMMLRKILFLLIGFIVCGESLASQQGGVLHRSFWQPYYHGQRLNYCSLDGKKCGLAVATRYCRIMGYARADEQIIANNIGLTHYISSAATCVGWHCDGFKTIRCTNRINHKPPAIYHYRLRHFVYPRFNLYRVDWCYDGTKGCGQRAAFSFCRRMGYMQARGFSIEKGVAATKAIGNQKLCFGKNCRAFKKIDCYR